MTPCASDGDGASRSRGTRSPDDLYESLGWALLRAPLLPASASEPDSQLAGDPRARLAISVASPDLARALERPDVGDRRAHAARQKRLRYLIRMSTRPTPYGLFAGVGLVAWAADTDVALGPELPRTRTRPDMGWLIDWVGELQSDATIRPDLRLRANSAILVRGGRVFVFTGSAPTSSVRATPVTMRALELARQPILRTALAQDLGAAPGATADKVAHLIDELCRQHLLLSDLAPRLTGSDPARDLHDRLAQIPAGRAAAAGLAALLQALDAWDALPFDERLQKWPELFARQRSLHPAASANLLQTDMALPLAGTRVQAAIAKEAARAAELLLRLSPLGSGESGLSRYRDRFVDRYGVDGEVPLLELVHPELGLGLPEPSQERDDREASARRARLLRDLALNAQSAGLASA